MTELIGLDSSKEGDEDATVQEETLNCKSLLGHLVDGTADIFQNSDPC